MSGPPISVARTGPPLEARSAPAIPETASWPPPVDAVTVTSAGTVTSKSTVQPEFEHAGSDRLRRPPDTDCVTTGGWVPWSYATVSVTWTWLTWPDVTCTWPP